MRRVLEVGGFLLTLFGVCVVVRELTDGWFRLRGATPEVFAMFRTSRRQQRS